MLELTGQTAKLLAASVQEARAVAGEAGEAAVRLARSRKPKLRRKAASVLHAVERLETLVERSQKVVEQIAKRLAGEPISDRLVSLFDPDARPIRKGKLGRPTEFGYVEQLAEVTPNTKPGARGFLLPPASAPSNPGENELLPTSVAGLQRLGLSPREVALDGGFQTNKTAEALAPLAPERTFIAGRASPGSRRTKRRLARYRVGSEGRTSHLKRRHGFRRSRLKGRRRGAHLEQLGGLHLQRRDVRRIRVSRMQPGRARSKNHNSEGEAQATATSPARSRSAAAGLYPGEVARPERTSPRPSRYPFCDPV